MGLAETAKKIVANGKGILAADESTRTIKKRLDGIGVESTEDSRRAYRELLFTTNELQNYISGVIMYDETFHQKSSSGVFFRDMLKEMGIAPGIKVDTGAKDLAGFPGEKVTEGLDGLRERLAEYRELGAEFAKWRGVIQVLPDGPSDYCIHANAHALARYAKLCQENDIVPIVEPEVIMDGGHSLEDCKSATTRALKALFAELGAHQVELEGILLKPNMVVPGSKSGTTATPEEVAKHTVETFKETVPSTVPGIVFLSGGQSDIAATVNLNAMNAAYKDLPWKLSYSYGRALQAPALAAWEGKTNQIPAAQAALALRSKCNTAAATGTYSSGMEA